MGLGAWVKAVFFGALGVAGLHVFLGSLNLLRKIALTRVSRSGSVDPGRAEVVGRVATRRFRRERHPGGCVQ